MDGEKPYVVPRLFDIKIDQKHRSYYTAVKGVEVSAVKARVSNTYLPLHTKFIPRLHEIGLLPFACLVNRNKPFPYDYPLMTSMIDRWRLETITFHLRIGEVTLTLQDVSMLCGLPLKGKPVYPVNVPNDWREDLNAQFLNIPRKMIEAKPGQVVLEVKAIDTTHSKGPPLHWLRSLSPDYMPDDADEATISLYLEAYLLWLFGYVMFCNTQGNIADKFFVPYAKLLADMNNNDCMYSWGSAVLVVTYAGLSKICITTRHKMPKLHTLMGCPLLLNLFVYERFIPFVPD